MTFADNQPVRIDTWGLAGVPLTIAERISDEEAKAVAEHLPGPWFKIRADDTGNVLPGNYNAALIRLPTEDENGKLT
jgi:hypothetical protein